VEYGQVISFLAIAAANTGKTLQKGRILATRLAYLNNSELDPRLITRVSHVVFTAAGSKSKPALSTEHIFQQQPGIFGEIQGTYEQRMDSRAIYNCGTIRDRK